MTTRFDTVWQTAKYLESLERLARRQPVLKQRVRRVLERYYDRPESLQRTIIHNPKRRVFHTRVDDEKRIVDEPLDPSRPNEVAILYVGHHDEANEWAAQYRGDTLKLIERATRLAPPRRGAQSGARRASYCDEQPACSRGPYMALAVEESPGSKTSGRPRTAARYPRGSFGEHISARKLRKLGVPPELVEAVLCSSAGADLIDSGLPEEVAERVYAWYQGRVPLPMVPRPVPALEPPEAIAVTRAELGTVLTLSLSQLLAALTEEQRALARRPNRNLYVVKGAAGSGKTVIGVRRIEYLRQQRQLFDRPILFLCYNKVLANAARQMIADTLGESLEQAGVEVWAAYELLASLQAELGLTPPRERYVGPERLLPLLARARRADSASLLADWTDRALLDEILEVIYGRGLSTLADYRVTNRRGRGRALRREGRHRAAIWAVHERLRALCDQHGIAPWDDLPVRVLRHLVTYPPAEPRYSALVIDEAQDLLPSIFQVLLRLQAGRDENMLVLGDAAQNVYRSGFRWGHTGLNVSPGQVTYLRRCFRSTPSIIGAATPLIGTQQRRLEGDLVVPEGGGDPGPAVEVTFHQTLEDELDAVALSIADRIAAGLSPSLIAVLIDDKRVRAKLRGKLDELEVRSEDFTKSRADRRIDIFDQSVKLLTVASAKGIEFQVTYVPLVTETNFPSGDDDGETADRARRILYTAMTRCAWELRLSAHGSSRSALLRELDARFVEYTDHCPHVATGHPNGGDGAAAVAPSARQLGIARATPTGVAPTTVAAVMRDLFGKEAIGGPARFRDDGWSYEGESRAECPQCSGPLHVLRKPYTTSAGKAFRYWAITCAQCGVARELGELDGTRQQLVRRVAPRH